MISCQNHGTDNSNAIALLTTDYILLAQPFSYIVRSIICMVLLLYQILLTAVENDLMIIVNAKGYIPNLEVI